MYTHEDCYCSCLTPTLILDLLEKKGSVRVGDDGKQVGTKLNQIEGVLALANVVDFGHRRVCVASRAALIPIVHLISDL